RPPGLPGPATPWPRPPGRRPARARGGRAACPAPRTRAPRQWPCAPPRRPGSVLRRVGLLSSIPGAARQARQDEEFCTPHLAEARPRGAPSAPIAPPGASGTTGRRHPAILSAGATAAPPAALTGARQHCCAPGVGVSYLLVNSCV